MDASATPAQRVAGMFVTLTGLVSLILFGLATWIAGIALAEKDQSPANRWAAFSFGVFFAIAFAAGPIAGWAEYKRGRPAWSFGYAAAPYAALAICWLGLKTLAH